MSDPELAKRARPLYTPYSLKEPYIVTHGGASWGSPSFSPRTGLLYVTGKNATTAMTVKVVGNTLRPAEGAIGHTETIDKQERNPGLTPTEMVTAYNPATSELVWQVEYPTRSSIGSAGNVVTGGGLVFQGSDTGDLYAFDAQTGKELLKQTSKKGIRSSPMTYEAGGKQYVAVVATDTILAFGLTD
jgi:outer membrane protein assembly factor BamB